MFLFLASSRLHVSQHAVRWSLGPHNDQAGRGAQTVCQPMQTASSQCLYCGSDEAAKGGATVQLVLFERVDAF